jgi:hypothetical protein
MGSVTPRAVLLLSSTGDIVGYTYTDESGAFNFKNLPRDTYSLVIPGELDQALMSSPYPIDITTKNADVSIQLSAGGISLNVEVLMLSQNISFALTSTLKYGDEPLDLSATTDSNLPIIFVSSDPAIAEVADGKLVIKSVGEVTITASQAGDDFYSAADVDKVITIDKGAQHISLEELPAKTFGDPSFTVAPVSSADLTVTLSSSDTEIASIEDNTIIIHAAGTVTITASQNGNDLYEAAESLDKELTIAKASQLISFDMFFEKNSADEDFEIPASSSALLPITFISDNESVATVSGKMISIQGAGVANITATQLGNGNYNAAEAVTRTLTVNQVTGLEVLHNRIMLYPNPTKGLIFIESEKAIKEIIISDVAGRVQFHTTGIGNVIDISGINAGIYILTVQSTAGSQFIKVFKE